MRGGLVTLVAIGGATLLACARPSSRPTTAGDAAVALSGGPNASMIYLARTGAGVVAIDLGWWGAARTFRAGLRALGARPEDVRHVLLTHSHRDHVGLWHEVTHARFYLANAELPALVGLQAHRGWIPNAAERLRRTPLPDPGELDVRTFSSDTTMVFGVDTVVAYNVRGHTAGSVAYLMRGTLFVGDAVTYTPWGGFAPARRGFSDDADEAARNLRALWSRIPAAKVHQVCTAHAKCAPLDSTFLADVQQ